MGRKSLLPGMCEYWCSVVRFCAFARTDFRPAGHGCPGDVNAQHAVAVRTEYYARPGRRAIVVSDLASLRGPSRGTVELPLRLYWSGTLPTLPRLPSQKRVTSLITCAARHC